MVLGILQSENIPVPSLHTKDESIYTRETLPIRTSIKRGPSTPLTNHVKHLVRRKMSPSSQPDSLLSTENMDLLDSKYEAWLSQLQLKHVQDLLAFMELERLFSTQT